MRYEIVVETEFPEQLDVIRLGTEVARLISADTHGMPAQLIHCAVAEASSIVVPRDFNDAHPVFANDFVPEPEELISRGSFVQYVEDEEPVRDERPPRVRDQAERRDNQAS